MTDIAIMVGEEFQRRQRWEEPAGGANVHISMVPYPITSLCMKVKKKLEISSMKIREGLAMEVVKQMSPFALAVLDGSLSA